MFVAHTALYPHELMDDNVAITVPFHGISFGFVRDTASRALTRGAVFWSIGSHAGTAIFPELDGFLLSPRVLALLPSLLTTEKSVKSVFAYMISNIFVYYRSRGVISIFYRSDQVSFQYFMDHIILHFNIL